MQRSLHVPFIRGRKLAASLCLVATVLLWSPLWAAAWEAGAMACCNGGFCPIHGHAGQHHSATQAAMPSAPATECDHHHSNGSGMACSMSCCHDTSAPFTAAIVFLPAAPTLLSQATLTFAAPASPEPAAFASAVKPLSPPPRNPLTSL